MKKKKMYILMVGLMVLFMNNFASAGSYYRNYNALLIGNGEYKNAAKLRGPIYDVPRVRRVLNQADFSDANGPMYINDKTDLTRNEMIDAIRKTFRYSSPEDVNYFYYGGHGVLMNDEAYISGIDAEGRGYGFISSRELKNELDRVAGTKVIILDACHSGGFISDKRDMSDDIKDFNDRFIDTFMGGSRGISGQSYKIITAASKDELAWDIRPGSDPDFRYGGEFSIALIRGLGYLGQYEADLNDDGKITIDELATYLKWSVKDSHVQSYSRDMDFLIYEYGHNFGDKDGFKRWTDIVQKVDNAYKWTIKFNKPVEYYYGLEDKVFILDKKTGEEVHIVIEEEKDKDQIKLFMKWRLDPGRYFLYVDEGIKSTDGTLLKDKWKLEFQVED